MSRARFAEREDVAAQGVATTRRHLVEDLPGARVEVTLDTGGQVPTERDSRFRAGRRPADTRRGTGAGPRRGTGAGPRLRVARRESAAHGEMGGIGA